jgi:hypothetical protein
VGGLSGRTLRIVPVEFLSDEKAAAYGRFTGEPSRAELERFFFLDDATRARADKRRGDHNRLGFALQLGTARFLGTFLLDPLDVPWPVVEYLAEQLGVADVSVAKRYAERLPTQHEHAREIRQAYGYRDLSDPDAAAGLREFLDGRAWTHAEGPYRMFGQAVGWLRRNRVLLPGVSVLARLVASVRDGAGQRMFGSLADAATAADPALPSRLQGLLAVPDGQRVSELEPSLNVIKRAVLERLGHVRLERVKGVAVHGADEQLSQPDHVPERLGD